MAILVVALHARPFMDISADLDYYISGVLSRLAVPYFFMVSGFFLFSKMPIGKISWERIKRYCIRLGKIFLAWTIIYMPIAVYAVWHENNHFHKLLVIMRDTIFRGELMYHLWYLHASIIAVITLYFLFSRGLKLKAIIVLALFLHLILIMSRGYYGLYVQYLADFDIIKISIAMLSKLFSSGNGWTFGLLYMSVGGFFAWHRNRYSLAILAPLLLLALVGFFTESYFIMAYDLLNPSNKGNTASYVMLLLVILLFLWSVNVNLKDNPIYKHLREQSLFIYLVHPWFLFLGTGIAKKVLHIEEYHMGVFLVTVVLSIIAAEFLRKLSKYKRFSWLG